VKVMSHVCLLHGVFWLTAHRVEKQMFSFCFFFSPSLQLRETPRPQGWRIHHVQGKETEILKTEKKKKKKKFGYL